MQPDNDAVSVFLWHCHRFDHFGTHLAVEEGGLQREVCMQSNIIIKVVWARK